MFVMYKNSRRIGNIGEAVAIAEFIKRDIEVFLPFGQNTPVDMLILHENKWLKIQVKTTEKVKNGVMRFALCRTNGFTGISTPYQKGEVDFIFLYCIQNEYKGIVPFEKIDGKRQLNIRLEKPKNNQSYLVNMADDFSIEKRFTIKN